MKFPEPWTENCSDLLRVFNKEGVEYLLIGSMAESHYRSLANVGDMDVLINPTPENATGGRACNDTDRRLRGSEQLIQHACEGSGRAHSLIHAEAEQKRKAGHRWDRVESRIESLIQGRVRSRGWDFSR